MVHMYKHFHVHQQVDCQGVISFRTKTIFLYKTTLYEMVFVRLLFLCTKWSPVYEMVFVRNESHSLSTVDQWSLCVFDNPVLYTSVFLSNRFLIMCVLLKRKILISLIGKVFSLFRESRL